MLDPTLVKILVASEPQVAREILLKEEDVALLVVDIDAGPGGHGMDAAAGRDHHSRQRQEAGQNTGSARCRGLSDQAVCRGSSHGTDYLGNEALNPLVELRSLPKTPAITPAAFALPLHQYA